MGEGEDDLRIEGIPMQLIVADKLDCPLFCEGKLVLGALEEVPVVLVRVGKVLIRYHPSMVLDVRWFHLLLVLNVVDGHRGIPDGLCLLCRQVVFV